MHFYRGFLLIFLSGFVGIATFLFAPENTHAQQQSAQRAVEDVQIIGNRRLRREDILYWIQIRPGDPFSEAQIQRDMQAILQLGFFDKVKSRVYTEEGPRGGIVVIFEVKELPIIRDLQFEGLHSVAESDLLKAFRERHVGVSKESIYDPVKARTAVRVIKELLSSHGHPNATVEQKREDISQTSIGLTFVINEGDRVRVMEIQFEGNQIFSDKKLRAQMKLVLEAGLITRFQSKDILDREKLDYDLRKVQNYMRSKGYLQARYGEPRVEGIGKRRTGGLPLLSLPLPLISSVDEGLRITVPITEGKIYRIGEIKITGNSIFPEAAIRGLIGLGKGDVANGEKIGKAVYENLKKAYGNQGFIEYTAELNPTFKDNPQNANEGIVDFTVTVDEGKQFTLSRLEFIGNTFTRDNVLRREVLLNEGDIYSQSNWEFSTLKINQLGYFDPIDKDKDADFKTNEEQATVAIDLKVTEKGRQQISFNGGLSGIGGSFFGLDYSTNNLLGRGEVLSLQFAAGNRQKSLQFSFTEPYIKNRPVTAGFSIFAFQQQFFGEGTVLSQNANALQALSGNPIDALNVNEQNLFTRTSYGASIFASAPLSEFYKKRRFTQASRIGLSYQISQSSVKDPVNNSSGDTTKFIPVIYAQDKIITSRATGSFSFDTRNASVDPTQGKELSLSLAIAGLGGDVRSYGPTLSYSQFFRVRRKKSEHAEVFGFRLIAATVGSFATSSKIRNSQSLAFVDGTPIFERFFLGDEFTIRGYNVRSISPITPLDTFITSRNVVLASNATGTAVPVPGVPTSLATTIGIFTGVAGNNSVKLPRRFTPIGGDTQLLGNFEYRIPIVGDRFGAALFTDIGSAFNLRSKHDQFFSSNFLDDEPFLQTTGGIICARVPAGAVSANLSSLAACNANTQLAMIGVSTLFPGLVMRDNRLVTTSELDNARCPTCSFDPITGLPSGFQEVFLRGQAQTNTAVRLSQALFSNFRDYRASMGLELRLQVPVINVPFRLIFAYNPNARKDQLIDGFPLFFQEKKFVPRFSIGRTF